MHFMHLMPLQVGRSSSEHPSILQQLRIMRADDFERCCGAPAVVHILTRRVLGSLPCREGHAAESHLTSRLSTPEFR